MRGKKCKAQTWLETLAVAFEVFIAGMLILFFLNQGVAMGKGAAMTSQYLANDLALSLEAAAGITADKMVINYAHPGLKNYKIDVSDTVGVEKITGVDAAAQQVIQIPGLLYTRASAVPELFVVKVGNKAALIEQPTTVDELSLGSSPVSRVRIMKHGGVVAYEAS